MPKLTYVYSDPSTFSAGETPYGTYDSYLALTRNA